MRILVTGGRGWIGSHLCPELLTRGHDVVSVDRDDGDLARDGGAHRLIVMYNPDIVVHLAARPGRIFGENDVISTIEDNTIASTLVAKACGDTSVRLCYISTSEVYGERNLYGLTKFWGEQVSQLYSPKDLLIIRPSMAYGPNMPTGYGRAALPTMIDYFLHGKIYTIHRDCYRSWIYIDDLVRGMTDVIERGEGTYNVGRDDDLRSMEDLAHLVRDVLGTDPDLILLGEHDSTITPIKDISMARLRSLGWEPRVDIEDGIKMTANSLLQKP